VTAAAAAVHTYVQRCTYVWRRARARAAAHGGGGGARLAAARGGARRPRAPDEAQGG
jgi:hypothetical protein